MTLPISRNTLIAASLSLAMLTGACAVFVGAWYSVERMESALYAARVASKQAEDERMQLAALEKLRNDTADERARLATYVVGDDQVIGYLAEVEGLAKRMGVTPTTREIATRPIEGDAQFEELVVTEFLEGSSAALRDTIKRLETMPYQTRIDSMTLAEPVGGVASAELRLIVTKRAPHKTP